MQYKFELISKKLGKTWPACKGTGRMLDIGCSEGIYVAACQKLGWDAYGFEVDTVKMERAKGRGLQVSAPDYDGLEKDSFDFIMIRHVLEHISVFLDVFDTAVGLLKPGGVLCVETPNQASMKYTISPKKVQIMPWGAEGIVHIYPPTHIHAFTAKAWQAVGAGRNMKTFTQTYAPVDPDWMITSTYHKRGIVPMVHNISAKIGMGESIAAFFQKAEK